MADARMIMRLIAAWAMAIACLSGGPALAAPKPATPPTLTTSDANSWLDGAMPVILQQGKMAGAVVVIVKDGQILTSRGYGLADVDRHRPVDPVKTLFRVGSVSKLMTWLAVMQLVERGRIDLDRDINAYLDFRIPPLGGEPVTMRHLLTHSAGFEDDTKYLIVTGDGRNPPRFGLEQFVRKWVPRRVFAAGSTTAYSNYGASLAGYIVARVSGETFDDYIDRHIFGPLGMSHSTFRQPVPPALLPDMAAGYESRYETAEPFEYVAATAAGSMTTTGGDMARFMIAYLQNGRFGSQQILRPATVAAINATDVRRTPHLPGFGLGFYHEDRNGQRILGHGGDTQWFHADVHLLVDQNVGVFIAVNSASEQDWRTPFLNAFMNRYFPPAAPRLTNAGFRPNAQHTAELAGIFLNQRRPFSGPVVFTNLARQFAITANEDGTVSGLPAVESPKTIRWQEVDNYLWREVGGDRQFAAVVTGGKITGIQLGWLPPVMIFEKVPTANTASLLLWIVGLSGLILALSLVEWIARPVLRKALAAPAVRDPDPRFRLALKCVALCGVAALVLLGLFASMFDAVLDPARTQIDTMLVAIQLLFWLTSIGAVLALANLGLVIRRSRKLWPALKALAMLAACSGLAWFAFTQNLLTMRVEY